MAQSFVEEGKGPMDIGLLGMKRDEVKGAIKILDLYWNEVAKQIKLLETQLHKIEQEINESFGEMK